MLRNGIRARAKNILERFSSVSGPRFDLFLAYAKLAIEEGRWFDAFVHAQLAANQPMPKSWDKAFQQTNRIELDKVRIRSVAARGNWAHVKELAGKYAVKKETDEAILELAAQAEFHLDNPKGAFEIYQAMAEAKVDWFDPFVALAKLYESSNNNERAEDFFKRAVKPKLVDGRTVLEYVRWLIWQNRPGDAELQLERLGSAAEYSRERDYLLALAARAQRDFQAARNLLAPLHESAPKAFAYANQLALVLIELPDEPEHLRALEIARANVEANPDNIEAWSTLGWIQLNLNQLEDAQASLARSTRLGQVSRDTAYYLSELRKRLGDAEAAKRLRSQAETAEGLFFYSGR
jgi:tetratricopeptide (TPR) repeat protein